MVRHLCDSKRCRPNISGNRNTFSFRCAADRYRHSIEGAHECYARVVDGDGMIVRLASAACPFCFRCACPERDVPQVRGAVRAITDIPARVSCSIDEWVFPGCVE